MTSMGPVGSSTWCGAARPVVLFVDPGSCAEQRWTVEDLDIGRAVVDDATWAHGPVGCLGLVSRSCHSWQRTDPEHVLSLTESDSAHEVHEGTALSWTVAQRHP